MTDYEREMLATLKAIRETLGELRRDVAALRKSQDEQQTHESTRGLARAGKGHEKRGEELVETTGAGSIILIQPAPLRKSDCENSAPPPRPGPLGGSVISGQNPSVRCS